MRKVLLVLLLFLVFVRFFVRFFLFRFLVFRFLVFRFLVFTEEMGLDSRLGLEHGRNSENLASRFPNQRFTGAAKN